MKERMRTMANELDVKGTYVLEMFIRYQENKLFINRRYQRKLVWTVEEKQEFINTILLRYPVPLFLLVKYKADGTEPLPAKAGRFGMLLKQPKACTLKVIFFPLLLNLSQSYQSYSSPVDLDSEYTL